MNFRRSLLDCSSLLFVCWLFPGTWVCAQLSACAHTQRDVYAAVTERTRALLQSHSSTAPPGPGGMQWECVLELGHVEPWASAHRPTLSCCSQGQYCPWLEAGAPPVCVNLPLDPTMKPVSFQDYVLMTTHSPGFPAIFLGSACLVLLWFCRFVGLISIGFPLFVYSEPFGAISDILVASSLPLCGGPPSLHFQFRVHFWAPSIPIGLHTGHCIGNLAFLSSLHGVHEHYCNLSWPVCLSSLGYHEPQAKAMVYHDMCLVIAHP